MPASGSEEAVGPDAAHVEDTLFDDAIHTVTSGRLTRHETRRPSDGPIAFDAFRDLLLADLPLGQLVENEAADRKSSVDVRPDPGADEHEEHPPPLGHADRLRPLCGQHPALRGLTPRPDSTGAWSSSRGRWRGCGSTTS